MTEPQLDNPVASVTSINDLDLFGIHLFLAHQKLLSYRSALDSFTGAGTLTRI
jgi:hypothetical protein